MNPDVLSNLAVCTSEKISLKDGSQICFLNAGLGRIAGILSFEVEDKNASLDSLQRVGSELAMHVVAAKPLFLTRDHVSSDALENEREILKSQVLYGSIIF